MHSLRYKTNGFLDLEKDFSENSLKIMSEMCKSREMLRKTNETTNAKKW